MYRVCRFNSLGFGRCFRICLLCILRLLGLLRVALVRRLLRLLSVTLIRLLSIWLLSIALIRLLSIALIRLLSVWLTVAGVRLAVLGICVCIAWGYKRDDARNDGQQFDNHNKDTNDKACSIIGISIRIGIRHS